MTDQEINEAVARKLGWIKMEAYIPPRWIIPNAHPASNCPSEVPNYCNDIKAAWEIVENVGKPKPGFGSCLELIDSGHEWTAVFCEQGELPEETHIAQADTAPKAICLAFLALDE